MPKNGYRSHRGYSAIARRVIMSGAAGSTNAIMSPLGYWGGMKKGGLAPSVPAMPVGARSLAGGRPPLVNHPQHLMHKTHGYGSWDTLCKKAHGYYYNTTHQRQQLLEFPNTGTNAANVCNMTTWVAGCMCPGSGGCPWGPPSNYQINTWDHQKPSWYTPWKPGGAAAIAAETENEHPSELNFQLAWTDGGFVFVQGYWVLNNYILNPEGSPTLNPTPFMWPIAKNSPLYNILKSGVKPPPPSVEQYWTEAQKDYEAFINTGSSGNVPAMYHLPAKFASTAAGILVVIKIFYNIKIL